MGVVFGVVQSKGVDQGFRGLLVVKRRRSLNKAVF